MKKSLVFLIIFIFSIFCVFIPITRATNYSDVVVNEVAWMGTTNSANDEWMEIYNNTANQIDLSGWSIQSSDGKLKINLKGTISANGFYLMERTDDTSVLNITADLIYTGALSNSGMDLKLYDNLNNLIDEVNNAGEWIAGDNSTKQTMEKNPAGWQTSEAPGGSPKAQNSAGADIATSIKTTATEPTGTTNEQTKNAITINYPSGIFINEILPNPEGPDETDEWIELYNSNNLDVDLSGWQIQDTIGTVKTYTIPQNTKILAGVPAVSGSFLVFKRPETKIMLNNDEDGLNLLTPDKKIVDSVNFTSAPLNQSYNKTSKSWAWSTTLTPGAKNILAVAQNLSNAKNSVKSSNINPAAADISQILNTNQNNSTKSPWFLFFTVLATTLILAIVVLFIKFKFLKNNVGT